MQGVRQDAPLWVGWLNAPGFLVGVRSLLRLIHDDPPSFQNMLFVEVPEYRNKHIRTSVKVNFYVINGKRKRSQPQHFTYHPGEALPRTSFLVVAALS